MSPSAANRFDCKFTCIATDANRYPGLVGINIVDAVGDRFAEFLVRKIVRVDLKRLSFRAILLSNIRFFTERFLLFRINRHRRTLPALAGPDPSSNMLKLGVAIGMVGAFSSFAIALQRVSKRTKNFGDLHSSDRKALCAEDWSSSCKSNAVATADRHVPSARQADRLLRSDSSDCLPMAFVHHRHAAVGCWEADHDYASSLIPVRMVRSESPVASATVVIPP